MNKNPRYFIVDFDSTFIRGETLDELARIALNKNPDGRSVLARIKNITNQGMEGRMSFTDSLKKRLSLLRAEKSHVEAVIKTFKKNVSPSIRRNKAFFRKWAPFIYIISGGFREIIEPIARDYGILPDHIFANTFIFDDAGKIVGFDAKNPLARPDGKLRQLKALNLKGIIYVIGDGYTDYQLREAGIVNEFIAFTENVHRDAVVKKADQVVSDFDEFLYTRQLPMSISYPKSRLKVLLLENIHPTAAELFKKEGYAVECLFSGLTEAELCRRIKEVSILGIRSKTEVSEKVISHAKKLFAIGAFCIGTNQMDLTACAQKGVIVFNAPYSNTRSVVELAFGEMIMLFRHTFEKNQKAHQGIWSKGTKGDFEMRGKKLGIVGYGNIGSQLSVLAEAFGMDVYYYDVSEKLPLGNAKKCNSLNELLKKADVVSLHVDGRSGNRRLMAEREFRLMKEGAIFLNLSRGHVVDPEALKKYLENGKLGGAAVDVFQEEPKSNADPFTSPLQGFSNVILTPHIGGSTEEAQKNIAEFVPEKLIRYINSGDTAMSVNFPGLQLPELQKAHRLIHIHHNVPGILARINGILAENRINIVGQYLKTNEKIGYAITDVSRTYDKKVMDEFRRIPQTIKFRVLY